MMAPVSQPGSAGTTHRSAPAARTLTDAQRAALFASRLQRTDAPTAAMAAQAITATLRQSGNHGCVGRMAHEYRDHPDAAAKRIRCICQLAAELPRAADGGSCWPREQQSQKRY